MVNIRAPSGSSFKTVWRMLGNQGSQWNIANVSIGDQGGEFVIEIIGYYPGNGILAIDDISFKKCAPPVPTKGNQ